MNLDIVVYKDLAPCPFCGGEVRITSNRDWHKLTGLHDENCLFDDDYVTMVPATDENKTWLIEAWHRRDGFQLKSVVKPAEISTKVIMQYVEESKKLPPLSTCGPITLTSIQLAYVAGKIAELRNPTVIQCEIPDGYKLVPIEPVT